MFKILHLSDTDINSDSRILKEMNSLANSNLRYKVSGIGVHSSEIRSKGNERNNLDIFTLKIKSIYLKDLPKIIRCLMFGVEIVWKMFFKSIHIKADILHCNDIIVLPVGVLVKIFTGTKLIYDAHELESNRNGMQGMLGKFFLVIEKLSWRFVDELITVSPSIEKWYQKNIGEKSSTIILNSPVLKEYNDVYDKKYLRDCFNISKDSKIFLYVGGFTVGRGIEYLIEVFKKNDIKSSLVFLGYGKMRDQLKKISEEYENIYVHDAVPHEEVISVVQGADIGLCLIQNVSLSYYYCLPNKLFEYAFAGVPVLASDFPDITEIVSTYHLGMCTPNKPDNIYDMVKKIENMDVLPQIDTSLLYDLSWNAQEEKLISLYARVVDKIVEGE